MICTMKGLNTENNIQNDENVNMNMGYGEVQRDNETIWDCHFDLVWVWLWSHRDKRTAISFIVCADCVDEKKNR